MKLSFEDDEDLAAELAQMVEDIWKRKGMPIKINTAVATAFAVELWSGIVEGFGTDLKGIDYETPDAEMLQNLQKSVYTFSAAKNYHQLKALTQALIGEDDKLRTYSQYKKQAFTINNKHVNQWLKTEYETAVAGGQMAGKWVRIQESKDTLPMLEFDAVMDGRTTELCASLNKVIRPVDDAFWKQYYPPNHFGCRSTVRQRSGIRSTPLDKIDYPEKMPEMFKVNLAEQGLAFPKNHAYFKDLPDDIINQGIKLIPDAE